MSAYLTCVAAWPGVPHLTGVPDIRPCVSLGEHVINHDDDACRGCAPRRASVGLLCLSHWRAVELAVSEWNLLSPYLRRFDRLGPRNAESDRHRSAPNGYVLLPQTKLDADEVWSWERGRPENTEAWVSTEDGAIRALRFQQAVQKAVRTHQIEERETKLRRFRCPDCGHLVLWRPPRFEGKPVTVSCSCGWERTDPDVTEAIAFQEALNDPRKKTA